MHFRFLGCIRRFELRARLGPSWRIGDSLWCAKSSSGVLRAM
jgi:hypothetical protein